MNITSTHVDGILVLRPEVEYIDVSNALAFREQVKSHFAGNVQVALDLSHVQFVDSAALGAILSCVRDASLKSVTIKLFGLTPPVRATIQLVRLHRVLHVLADLPEVLLSFGTAPGRGAEPTAAAAR